jgi:tryptophan-rich sensory protein
MNELERIAGPRRSRSRLGILPFIGATLLTAVLGARASRRGMGLWYRRLRKPSFNPPSWVFGPVWSALYAAMSWSAYRIWKQPPSRDRTIALRIWAAQLGLNGVWSPLFFGRHRPRAALVDLVALLGSVAAYIRVASRVDRVAAALFAPYLGWLGFAGVLNASIVRRNPA